MPLEVISRRRAIAQFLAMGTLAPGALMAGAPVLAQAITPPPTTLPQTQEDRLRALDAAQRLTVQVEINGQGPFPFLVDTGANSSAISRALATSLGLRTEGKAMLHGIAGQVLVDQVGVASVRTPRRLVRDMRLALVDDAGMNAQGLLGRDWLGEANLLIDYGRRRMVVGGALPSPIGETVAVPMRVQRNGLALIEGAMPGGSVVSFLDSGSNATVGNLALLEAARRHNVLLGETVAVDLFSITGQTLPGVLGVMSQVKVGGMWLHRLPVVMGPVHTFDYWGLKDEPALLIGADVLQKFTTIAWDYRRGEIRFTL